MGLLDDAELYGGGFTDWLGVTTHAAADEYTEQQAEDYERAHGQPMSAESQARIRAGYLQQEPELLATIPAGLAAESSALAQSARNVVKTAAADLGEIEGSILKPLILPALLVVAGATLFFFGPQLKILAGKLVKA